MEPMITERIKNMILFLINFTIFMTVFSAAWFLGYKAGKEAGTHQEKMKHIRNFRWPVMEK